LVSTREHSNFTTKEKKEMNKVKKEKNFSKLLDEVIYLFDEKERVQT